MNCGRAHAAEKVEPKLRSGSIEIQIFNSENLNEYVILIVIIAKN